MCASTDLLLCVAVQPLVQILSFTAQDVLCGLLILVRPCFMWHASMQNQATQQYEQEFEAFESGKYKESAQNWLHSSWQGDALQVSFCTHCLR